MPPTLRDVEDLARQAGEILREGFQLRPGYGRGLRIDFKGDIDLVTEMDHRSEAFLLDEIQRRFPDHSIASEESGFLKRDSGKMWYIDPMDGTVNYAHGMPLFTTSIAYAENGGVILGVVYDPVMEECFSAEKGRGAWLNGEPIKVSSTTDLGKSLMATNFPYDIRSNPHNNLDNYRRFSLLVQAMRHLGSAARDLSYVAAGRLDGYWEVRLHAWDIAAGGLIAEEAGAIVTGISGNPDYMAGDPHSVLAANRHLYPLMLEALKGENKT